MTWISRLHHAACVLPVYASQRRLPVPSRNTRFPLLARHCGARSTRRAPQRGFQLCHAFPPPPSFSQRTPLPTLRVLLVGRRRDGGGWLVVGIGRRGDRG